jgi:hypothetical protein
LSDAKTILQDLLTSATSGYISSTWIGGVYAALGETDQAFEWLGRAANDHSSTFPEFYSEPMFDILTKDRRLERLLKSIGLA